MLLKPELSAPPDRHNWPMTTCLSSVMYTVCYLAYYEYFPLNSCRDYHWHTLPILLLLVFVCLHCEYLLENGRRLCCFCDTSYLLA